MSTTSDATSLLTGARLLAAEVRRRIAQTQAEIDHLDGIEPQATHEDEIAARRARKAQTGPQGTF
jgi:hypothetical protein